jgi:coenzyme F420 hydrogenase subunit delta
MAVENSKIEPSKNSDTIYSDVVVLGCGNILFGDDGFGPYVAEYLQDCFRLPENVSVINAGTSVQGILFDLILSDQRPKKIIIIDAVDAKRKPGEVFRLDADELPQNKVDNYTLHQWPTSNLLRELKEFCKVDVTIVAGQIDHIPEAVKPGLSDVLMESVAVAAEEVLKSCNAHPANMKKDNLWKMEIRKESQS